MIRQVARCSPFYANVASITSELDCMADAGRPLHFLFALDKDGLDVAALHADGDGDLVQTDTRVASGMF